MSKRILVLACALLLGGCAVPVPLQIASWAVDGILYITTEKMLSDHGISVALQRDCAMLRVVTEGDLCRDGEPLKEFAALTRMIRKDDDDTAVNDAIPSVAGEVTTGIEVDADDVAERLASFETAAGEVLETVLLEQNWQEWTEAPYDEALLVETSIDAASLQAIVEAPSDAVVPGNTVALDAILEPVREPMSAPPAEYALNPGTLDTQRMIEELFDFIRGDDGLYFGDASHDPYLSGNDAITILGGAGDDFLVDKAGTPRSPGPSQAFGQDPPREYQLRIPPPHGHAAARGRSPPPAGDRAGNLPRLHI